MYNKFMSERELKVKAGDRVAVQGWTGTVTEVHRGYDTEWNGKEYVKVAGTDFTSVKVHFDSMEIGGQYQDGFYGGFTVLNK